MAANAELERIYERAHALASEDLYDEENAFLRKALERFPDDGELLVRLGGSELTTDAELAKRCLRRAFELTPDDPWRVARCAILIVDLEEFDDAERFALRAREIAPPDFVFRADISNVLGRVAYHRGEIAEADRLLTEAFEMAPGIPDHGAWLAHFLYHVTDEDVRALRVLAEALRHRPESRQLKEAREHILAYMRSHVP